MFVRYPVYTGPRYARGLLFAEQTARSTSSRLISNDERHLRTQPSREMWRINDHRGAFSREFAADRRDIESISQKRAFKAALFFKWFTEIIARPLANPPVQIAAILIMQRSLSSIILRLPSRCNFAASDRQGTRKVFSWRNFYYSFHVRRTRALGVARRLPKRATVPYCIYLWHACHVNFLVALFRCKQNF